MDACCPSIFRVTVLWSCVSFRLLIHMLACACYLCFLSSCIWEQWDADAVSEAQSSVAWLLRAGIGKGLRSLEQWPPGIKGVLWGLGIRTSPALASCLVPWSPPLTNCPTFVMSLSRGCCQHWNNFGSMPPNPQNCEPNRSFLFMKLLDLRNSAVVKTNGPLGLLHNRFTIVSFPT